MKNKWISMASACVLMSAQGAYAAGGAPVQPAGSQYSDTLKRVFELNPVVVTGNGHRQLLKSTTTPVHVISKNLLKETGLTDFQDAMSRLMPQVSDWATSMCSYL